MGGWLAGGGCVGVGGVVGSCGRAASNYFLVREYMAGSNSLSGMRTFPHPIDTVPYGCWDVSILKQKLCNNIVPMWGSQKLGFLPSFPG